jgi:hypothetical protein
MASDTQTIGELLMAIESAQARMSTSNPHRRVFEQCAAAIVLLSSELYELKHPQTIGISQAENTVAVPMTITFSAEQNG